MKKFIILLLLFFFVTGCAYNTTVSKNAKYLKAKDVQTSYKSPIKSKSAISEPQEKYESYRLGPHDVLEITILNRETITRKTEIRDDGMISFPLIGNIQIAGLTVPELQTLLTQRLSEYITKPNIDIQIIKYGSLRVAVLGEVEQPGIIFLRGKTTILEAVAMAGGITEDADLINTYLIRGKDIIPIDFYALFKKSGLSQNIEVKKRDIVYIPNVLDRKIFVLGEVVHPTAVPMRGKMFRVADAISCVGDFKISARKSNVKVIRGGLKDPTVITVDFNRLLAGDLRENIPLKSGDIVFAPASAVGEWNKILQLITPSMNTILLGVAIGR
ncbi:MAG: polysaccharide biosynthesis/export family protein [Campylobacterota bacterium]|nr:polysaccharide biosynthesis/export family protein [Campylobacterota bacterium]